MNTQARDCIVPVGDLSQVGAARRAAVAMAEAIGLPEADRGRVALTVTELATNVARHGGGGTMVLIPLEGDGPGLEVVALDSGAGIGSLTDAVTDGFSTAGTKGTGLGAVARQADHCEVFTRAGGGTAVLARFFESARKPRPDFEIGGLSLPIDGESIGGDGWAMVRRADRTTIMVADGLGHGPTAAEASDLAVRTFLAQPEAVATAVMQDAHLALRGTRGAAIGIVDIHRGIGQLTFVGVGNIAGLVVTGDRVRSTVSHAGIVGHRCQKIQAFTYAWAPESVLIMHSDGLQQRWQLADYPGLLSHHPTLIASVLYRDYARGRDDVTVVAVKESRP